jgi:hypothetical protein
VPIDEADLPMTVDADVPMTAGAALAKFPPLKREGVELLGATASAAARAAAAAPDPAAVSDQEDEKDAGTAKDDEKDEHEVANILAHFETVLSKLSSDERSKLALTASGIDLYALCYDKDPQVIRALWQNVNCRTSTRASPFHHRTSPAHLIAQHGES